MGSPMLPLQIATDIVAIGELKVHAAQLIKRVRQQGRPLIITQHGKPASVLLSPQDYDRLVEQDRFLMSVREGMADTAAGRVIDDDAGDAELEAIYAEFESK